MEPNRKRAWGPASEQGRGEREWKNAGEPASWKKVLRARRLCSVGRRTVPRAVSLKMQLASRRVDPHPSVKNSNIAGGELRGDADNG